MACKKYWWSPMSLAFVVLLHCVAALPVRSEAQLELLQAVHSTRTFLDSQFAKTVSSNPEMLSAISSVVKLIESQQDIGEITQHSSDSSHYLVTFKLVMDVLSNKGCKWLKHVVEDEEFTCSDLDMKQLHLLLSISDATKNLGNALSRFETEKPVELDRCSWLYCNVFCNYSIALDVRESMTETFGCPIKPLPDSCPIDQSQC